MHSGRSGYSWDFNRMDIPIFSLKYIQISEGPRSTTKCIAVTKTLIRFVQFHIYIKRQILRNGASVGLDDFLSKLNWRIWRGGSSTKESWCQFSCTVSLKDNCLFALPPMCLLHSRSTSSLDGWLFVVVVWRYLVKPSEYFLWRKQLLFWRKLWLQLIIQIRMYCRFIGWTW